ncbi:aminotransferase A [Bacillus sp. HMF5848]|uniref:aminotransferase A n=1 Tax=Bacillus sp. HMF5848 TaxID=2495421 RepID=UPI000F76AA57|nr:aminotransferase A [Bacillus sp. HMF5848]RSK26826.1 aminotransferase A [Bacillus sp. HMF5848]
MEQLINKNVQNIQISGIRKFFNMVANYNDVVSLTIGQPDFPTPNHVKQAGINAIKENHTTYTHNAGVLELRQAASHFFQNKYNLNYNPENEIITTVGASQAIDIAFRTILEPGSEVILPVPIYPGYEPLIKLSGGVPMYIDTSEHSFKLTADLIEKHITEKTRCIILPYPSNPTGATLSQQEIADIATLLKGRDIFILSDEIYSELTYEGTHTSIAEVLREQTIVINGLSKSHSMTGWRVGFAMAPEFITRHMLKVHQYNVSCTSSVSQFAALEALTVGQNDAINMKREYTNRLDYVYNRLVNMGIDTTKPTGAFYIFPSIEKFQLNSFDFAEKLVKEAGVAVVPGSAFSNWGEGYIRISYACSMNTLEKGLDRFETAIKKWSL